jgi:hypothetical protein
MAPILDELAHDRKGEVLVVKLNTDQNPGTMIRFGVRGIPTLIVFTAAARLARRARCRGHSSTLSCPARSRSDSASGGGILLA